MRLLAVIALAVILLITICMCSRETQDPTLSSSPSETTVAQTDSFTEISRGTLFVMGDMIPHTPIIEAAERGSDQYSFDNNFTYIAPYVQEADLAVANLETTLAGNDNGYSYTGYPNFNCPDAIVDALKNAGFDLLLTANNHSNDSADTGIRRTIQVVRDAGLIPLGTKSSTTAPGYTIQTVGDIRLGMVCYTYGQIDKETGIKSVNLWPVDSDLTERIHVFDTEDPESFYLEMEEHIAQMKLQGAEQIVLFIHWGNEYRLTPSVQQKKMAQKLCDMGVDIIIGSHPHVIQPISLLTSTEDPSHKTLCVYSLGNALSNQRASSMNLNTGHTEDGLALKLTFVKYADSSVYLDGLEALPTWVYVRYGEKYRSYDILPLDTSVADWKTALDIGSTNLEYAQASYRRTMEQIQAGLDQVEAYLQEARAQRKGS